MQYAIPVRLLGDGCYFCMDTHVECLMDCVYRYHLVPFALLIRDVVFIRTALSLSQTRACESVALVHQSADRQQRRHAVSSNLAE